MKYFRKREGQFVTCSLFDVSIIVGENCCALSSISVDSALAATRHFRDRRGIRYLGEFLGIICRANERGYEKGRRNKERKALDRRNGTLCDGNGRKGHRGCLGLSSIGSRFMLYTGEKRRLISGQLTTETGIYRGYDFLCSRFSSFLFSFSTRIMITAGSAVQRRKLIISFLVCLESKMLFEKKNETSSLRSIIIRVNQRFTQRFI